MNRLADALPDALHTGRPRSPDIVGRLGGCAAAGGRAPRPHRRSDLAQHVQDAQAPEDHAPVLDIAALPRRQAGVVVAHLQTCGGRSVNAC